jgi:hypothetical protein
MIAAQGLVFLEFDDMRPQTFVIQALAVAAIAACSGVPGGSTPIPVPTGAHLATAPVPPPGPEELGGFPIEAPPSFDPPSMTPQPAVDAAAQYLTTVHDPGVLHGPAGAICNLTVVEVGSSTSTWPGFNQTFTVGGGGGSVTYIAELVGYRGWLGWKDGNGNYRYQPGPWVVAYGSLNSLTDRAWVLLDSGWAQVGVTVNASGVYYGTSSRVPLSVHGSFWTWMEYWWGPIRQGTPEHPGSMVFSGASHLDYVGISTC